MQQKNRDAEPEVDHSIFLPALLVVLVTALPLIIFPEASSAFANQGMSFITYELGWLYLVCGVGSLGFALWLAFGPFGTVKLGAAGEKPEYSTTQWVAMMFTAGIGAGLIAWGFAETIFYLESPPLGIEPHSSEAIEWAHMYPLLHWGIVPWAMYTIPAVPIAYMLYVKRTPKMRMSSACENALPKTGRKNFKTIIDIFIVIGIIGGTTTSLGLGVPLVSAFITELLGVADSITVKLLVLLSWTLLFGASAYRGLKKGISILADINMVLAGIAILFVLLAGPTVFILSLTVNSLGLLVDNLARTSLWMDPVLKSRFPEDWTIFYWAWWLAFAAIVGLFFGRISRGRTIRQLVLGVICWGSLGTWAFLAVASGYSLHLQAENILPLSEILVNDGMSVMVAKVIASLPLGKFTLLVFIILSVIFYATSMDSAAFVLASICAKDMENTQEPRRTNRLIWAALISLVTVGVIVSGSLDTVKSATILTSLPLIPILILMSISTVKWLREDFSHVLKPKEMTNPSVDILSDD